MKVTAETRSRIHTHYHAHANTYNRIWGQLDEIYGRFHNTDRDGRIAYLKLSYINSVISVQCPLHIHEEALTRVMNGADLEYALESVNYNGQKKKYIRETLADGDVFHDIADALESGDVDTAHKIAIDRLKFVGTVKVPFTFANLGYTQKMCLDANVIRVLGIEKPTTVVVDRYEKQCQKAREQFPELADAVDPYHLQWVIFDYQRFNRTNMNSQSQKALAVDKQVTYHDSWFDAALSDVDAIADVVESLA